MQFVRPNGAPPALRSHHKGSRYQGEGLALGATAFFIVNSCGGRTLNLIQLRKSACIRGGRGPFSGGNGGTSETVAGFLGSE